MDRPRSLETLLWILLPILATFVGQRLYLHFIDPNADAFIAGYNIHHLFVGALIEIPAGIVLAFGIRRTWAHRAACGVFGVGGALVLDEVVYLITTDGSNAAYLTPISLWGAVILILLAVLLVVVAYRIAKAH